MASFKKLTPINGFDFKDLNNARQNNYAWSMSELGDYIYVGTGRNILLTIIQSLAPGTKFPALLKPDPVDNRAEIWRYHKNGNGPWEKVYKAPDNPKITGFRYMIQHNPFGATPALYAAGFGQKVQILKSTNGVNWFILDDEILEGTSSRAMIVHEGKLYVATINETNPSTTPLLYSSVDPEFYPWEKMIDPNAPGFDPLKNPTGAISNLAVFNERIYLATSNEDGVAVWRTNGKEPKMNEWTLIVDKGFGNPLNRYSLSMGVFKNHLYVSATKQLPLAWLIPMGCDIIRIDKKDKWELVVGGKPLIPYLNPDERQSISGLGSGFNNPFNVYAWQIQEYQGKLFISTFDDSSNMEVILTLLLANREAIEQQIGIETTALLIKIYKTVIKVLNAIHYPVGFDLYVSDDGVHFRSIVLHGLDNPNNYGGRILFKDNRNELYIGTSNPFQGCEVWKLDEMKRYDGIPCDERHYKYLWEAKKLINDNYDLIKEKVPEIMQFIKNRE